MALFCMLLFKIIRIAIKKEKERQIMKGQLKFYEKKYGKLKNLPEIEDNYIKFKISELKEQRKY